jgi:hypothetical protein
MCHRHMPQCRSFPSGSRCALKKGKKENLSEATVTGTFTAVRQHRRSSSMARRRRSDPVLPVSAKFGFSIAQGGIAQGGQIGIFQCSRHGSGTSERNSDEFYLFVDSIAIITVRLLFLFVMAQQSTRRSTMRREVHEEKCGILYCSRKARFGAVEPWPGDARPAAKIRHRFLQLFNTFVIAHQIRSGSTLADMQTSLPHARGFHRLTIPSA